MKAIWTGIRFWEEMETPSTELSSRALTQRMRELLASLPSWLITLRASRSVMPEREMATAKAPAWRRRGRSGAATQATAEGAEGLLEGETADQAADDGADGERDHHIDPQQAEHQHQRHRDNNRIHLLSL